MYPYPYPQAPYFEPPRPPQARTPQGMWWTLVGLFLAIGYFLAALAAGLLAFFVLQNLSLTNIEEELAAAAIPLLAAAAVAAVLGILALIFYFVGFGYLYVGRNEFGPTHARNLRISLILVIVILSVGFASLLAGQVVNSLSFQWVNWNQVTVNTGAIYAGIAMNIIFGIAIAALVAAQLVLSVRSLVRPERQMILNGAAALGTATPGIVGALTLLQLPRFLDILGAWAENMNIGSSGPPIDASFGYPAIAAAALSLVAMVLFVYVYWGAGTRIRTGEVKPLLPTPALAGPWMPSPGMPPYPIYPAIPLQPSAPPAQPPGPPGPP